MSVRFMVPLKNGIDAVKILPGFGAGAGGCAPQWSRFAGIQLSAQQLRLFLLLRKITTLKKQQKMPSRPTALKKKNVIGTSLAYWCCRLGMKGNRRQRDGQNSAARSLLLPLWLHPNLPQYEQQQKNFTGRMRRLQHHHSNVTVRQPTAFSSGSRRNG